MCCSTVILTESFKCKIAQLLFCNMSDSFAEFTIEMDWVTGNLPGFQRVENVGGRPFYLTVPTSGGKSLKLGNMNQVRDFLKKEGFVGVTEKDFDFRKRKGEPTPYTAPKSRKPSDIFGEATWGCIFLKYCNIDFIENLKRPSFYCLIHLYKGAKPLLPSAMWTQFWQNSQNRPFFPVTTKRDSKSNEL